MSRTLDLNKVSKAQRARKAWELLQEQQKQEKLLEHDKNKDTVNGGVSSKLQNPS